MKKIGIRTNEGFSKYSQEMYLMKKLFEAGAAAH